MGKMRRAGEQCEWNAICHISLGCHRQLTILSSRTLLISFHHHELSGGKVEYSENTRLNLKTKHQWLLLNNNPLMENLLKKSTQSNVEKDLSQDQINQEKIYLLSPYRNELWSLLVGLCCRVCTVVHKMVCFSCRRGVRED